ncbi:myeloid differentiation primary response protein MyD88-like protein [Sarcoptes scabiei]|uniref:Myeloid differentiation primary response protein MyD88-like protein n=1 Tax=Sarcoptes scabiei TaxID=52283 RepID=A0A132AGR6_SARSC|nr:myeloid differentiation primary response protein MyD88-like protein [Sarcoptes scabiei]
MSYEIDRNLMRLNVSNLQSNRRQQLSTYLNVEQILMSDCGFARDYRGLAQQLDLSYAEIAWLEKQIDPFGSLLGLEKTCKLSVYNLFEFLVTIGRFDVLDDMIPLILEDLNTLEIRDKQNFSLRSAPIENETTIWYDAYVCYADQDLDFVQQLVNYLESPTIGFRLFIRDRDLLVGNWIYETFARLIEKQCRRMIIILSPDFLQSPECKFQSMFAAGLAIEKCSRILVPIIYKPCTQLPSMLRLMSKIDMSGPKSLPEWSLKRLIIPIGIKLFYEYPLQQ